MVMDSCAGFGKMDNDNSCLFFVKPKLSMITIEIVSMSKQVPLSARRMKSSTPAVVYGYEILGLLLVVPSGRVHSTVVAFVELAE